jgi:RNA polymerase sigma factor (sigma-70 family)
MPADEDRRAVFEDLFARHYWEVRAYVLRRDRSSSGEDVLAETFLVAWRRLETIGDDPLPWLFGVARRMLANQRRGDRRRSALTDRLTSLRTAPGSGWGPPAQMSDQLMAAMIALPGREREALLLVAWEGLEPSRAARAAGCTPAAFRVRLHRARRRVAALLAESNHPHALPPFSKETP